MMGIYVAASILAAIAVTNLLVLVFGKFPDSNEDWVDDEFAQW